MMLNSRCSVQKTQVCACPVCSLLPLELKSFTDHLLCPLLKIISEVYI